MTSTESGSLEPRLRPPEVHVTSSPPMEQRPARLHHLDWLRILAILGVFLFHAVHPFDALPWHIKNAETSLVVTAFIVFMFP